jgi:hypothetical protein
VMVSILVNCAPSGEMHNYCTPHIIKENFLIHRYNYILLSQVYCVWEVVKTPTIILNNPVCCSGYAWIYQAVSLLYLTIKILYGVLSRMCALQLVWNPDAHEATVPAAPRYRPSLFWRFLYCLWKEFSNVRITTLSCLLIIIIIIIIIIVVVVVSFL